MDKLVVIEQLKKMKTVKDVAVILDTIKRYEFGSISYNISEKMLKHFSSDTIARKRFRTFYIRKKSGGFREIKAPCQQLQVILTCLNILFKSIYEPSDVAMGFTSGRSVLNNAQIHVGFNYVFNIDLKDFFPSISQARVWKRLQLPPFNFSLEIANVLAGLCCTYDESLKLNVLPQGSPTSPLLTNAICDKLDRRMKGVAKRFGIHYSRYADDMTFSSMHNVYQEDGDFRVEISRIIDEQGFHINESKTRLQKKDTRQEVTGLTVNAVANVSRKYISDLRWILAIWEKDGYDKAQALFNPKYQQEKGYIKKCEPALVNVISGKLNYLRMIRGESNFAYQKLAKRFEVLQEIIFIHHKNDVKNFRINTKFELKYSRCLRNQNLKVSLDGLLDIWEKGGIESAVEELAESGYMSITSRDSIVSGNEHLLNYFLNNPKLTMTHRKRLIRLLLAYIPSKPLKTDIEQLLSIWEKEGLDAAVREWKKLKDNKAN
ncbi:MAG: RNA-directed DNA polymerase [Barnesiella sp.]|nr:RNA-directed DNA polymerase [Barnesiella sp.]